MLKIKIYSQNRNRSHNSQEVCDFPVPIAELDHAIVFASQEIRSTDGMQNKFRLP
jgi:hypothetical protein